MSIFENSNLANGQQMFERLQPEMGKIPDLPRDIFPYN